MLMLNKIATCLLSMRTGVLKFELSLHLEDAIISFEPHKSGGSLNASYVAITKSGRKVLVKYTLFTRNALQQKKIRKIIDSKITSGFPKLITCYFSVLFLYCFVNEWVDGVPLDLAELNKNPELLKECARKVCNTLKELHRLDVVGIAHSRSLKQDYRRALHSIKRYGIDIPHYNSFVKYVDANIESITLKKRSVVHFDFHPGNIISNINDYTIIDLETICISDPWRDLVYAVEINFPEQQDFFRYLLLEYFDGNVPKEFFSTSKLYVIVYMLMLAKYNRKNLRPYFLLVNKVYSDYKNLNSEIPHWLIHH